MSLPAIPSNLLSLPNTESNGKDITACKMVGATGHPARFPAKLPEFFIRFLTDPGDVLDIFAGSNTTGEVAEMEGRNWLAFEERQDYVSASAFRFIDQLNSDAEVKSLYDKINRGCSVDLRAQVVQKGCFRNSLPAPPC